MADTFYIEGPRGWTACPGRVRQVLSSLRKAGHGDIVKLAVKPSSKVYVAWRGGRIAGWAVKGHYSQDPDDPHLDYMVFVRRSERRCGVGRALWRAASRGHRRGALFVYDDCENRDYFKKVGAM